MATELSSACRACEGVGKGGLFFWGGVANDWSVLTAHIPYCCVCRVVHMYEYNKLY
jgi:hypothetical protein